MKLSPEQKKQIDEFLTLRYPKIIVTDEDRERYKRAWARGGKGWGCLGQGGTGISRLILWYQNLHKPRSKEWRPAVMIRELLNYLSYETKTKRP